MSNQSLLRYWQVNRPLLIESEDEHIQTPSIPRLGVPPYRCERLSVRIIASIEERYVAPSWCYSEDPEPPGSGSARRSIDPLAAVRSERPTNDAILKSSRSTTHRWRSRSAGVRIHSQIAKYLITQFMCENSREGILATPTDDDTFLNKEKGRLFVLIATN